MLEDKPQLPLHQKRSQLPTSEPRLTRYVPYLQLMLVATPQLTLLRSRALIIERIVTLLYPT